MKCDSSVSTQCNSIDLDSPELNLSATSLHGVVNLKADYRDCLQTSNHVKKEGSVAEADLATEKIEPSYKQKAPDKMNGQDLIDYMKNMFAVNRQELKDHMNNTAL